MAKIKDFGTKIGGAKKDLWKDRGMIWSDTETMDKNDNLLHRLHILSERSFSR